MRLLGGLTIVLSVAACDERASTHRPIEVVRAFGEPGLYPGQLAYPRVLEAGAGSLWVIDKAARVQQLDPKTGRGLAHWRMPSFEKGKPVGMEVAIDADGPILYIADTHEHRVLVQRPVPGPAGPRPEGEPVTLARFGDYGVGPGQFIYPTDLALVFTPQGQVSRLYVSEYGGNDRVTCFDADHRPLFSFGRLGMPSDAAPGEIVFNRPQAIEFDPDRRELIVADACNHRLGRFTMEGDLIAWIGEQPGDDPGRFRYPYGLELLSDGTVLVAEFGNNRVQRIELETGRSLGIWGRAGRGPGELATPWGVAVLDDLVYVLDSGNSRIVAFDNPARGRRTSSR